MTDDAWRPKIARYAYMARLPPANVCMWRFGPLGPLDSSSRPPPAHSAVSASRPFSGRIRGLPLAEMRGAAAACAAVRLAPRPTPVRRRAGGPPQAAPPPIAPRRDAARSPEPTARRPRRCRRSARVSVLGRRAPGAAPEGRPRQPARASAALRLLSIAIMPLVTAAAAVDSAAPAPTSNQTLRSAAEALGAASARAPLPSPPLLLLLLSPPPPPPPLLCFSSFWFSSCRLHFPASCNSRLQLARPPWRQPTSRTNISLYNARRDQLRRS
eukprot:COSAG04_NODE_997_length_8867_cov_22.280908_9_plen_270_part_00